MKKSAKDTQNLNKSGGPKVVLGVSGSIAAYKAAELCGRLCKRGIDVTVVMSRSAPNFIGPATFSGLTRKEPVTDLSGAGFAHLDITKDLGVLVVAPATANIIAKLAAGIADCALSTIVLAAECPVIICPAMNTSMWFSQVNQRNVETVRRLGYEVVGPESGDLACGDSGWGRMAHLDDIENAVKDRLESATRLLGRKFVVTAGPTREYLDPVRFLSNPSSGKAGYAIAEELSRRGGETFLISGPTHLHPPGSVHFVPVETALEMRKATGEYFADADALIMTAAVSDHRFAQTASGKIAKGDVPSQVGLERNPDILAELGAAKRDGQIVIGFAAETQDHVASARRKLADKNLDMIVCTKVGFQEGFGADDIEALLIAEDHVEDLGRISKRSLAAKLADIFG